MSRRGENPHIPKYIKDAPWYADQAPDSSDPLAHHRNNNSIEDNSTPRIGSGIKDDFVVEQKKFIFKKRQKKGKCTNCGGEHHKTDCMEVPKRRIVSEKIISESSLKGKRNEDVDYDGKRDRWYGYDVAEYSKHISKWEQKKKEKEENEQNEKLYDTDEEIELRELGLWEEYSKDDVTKQAEEKTVRLREDKAVYLKDIRNDTITYDPKSRAIRDDDTGYFNEKNLFVRHLTGEAKRFEETKKFAWDETKRGLNQDNLIANPTLADRKIKEETELEKAKKLRLKKSLIDRYGAANENSSRSEESENELTVGDDMMI